MTKPEPAKKPQVDIAPQKAAAASEEKTTTRQDDAELATVEEISAPAVAKTAELAGDPLAPATETITPKPAEDADAAASGNGFGSFGSIGGFGGGMQPGGKDPLPAA